jgi:hypothetical protein
MNYNFEAWLAFMDAHTALGQNTVDRPCDGFVNCQICRDAWQALNNGRTGMCMLCKGTHWPWGPHQEDQQK